MQNNQKYPVTLYVYDISNGMAKTFGQMFTGKHVEGIWHTSICVYEKEFYYAGGIVYDPPKTTPHGQPVKELNLGHSELSPVDFMDYLKSIQGEFTQDSYDIFKKNCNHFTQNICEFLLGKGIPEEFLNQARDFENTPIGKMIGGFQVNMKNANSQQICGNQTQPSYNNNTQNQTQNQTHNDNIVIINDTVKYLETITGNEKVILDCYADWCGPCKMIKPFYSLLESKYVNVKFAKINVDQVGNKEICANLKIKAMPTFIILHKGEEVERLQGANKQKLEALVQKLNNR